MAGARLLREIVVGRIEQRDARPVLVLPDALPLSPQVLARAPKSCKELIADGALRAVSNYQAIERLKICGVLKLDFVKPPLWLRYGTLQFGCFSLEPAELFELKNDKPIQDRAARAFEVVIGGVERHLGIVSPAFLRDAYFQAHLFP